MERIQCRYAPQCHMTTKAEIVLAEEMPDSPEKILSTETSPLCPPSRAERYANVANWLAGQLSDPPNCSDCWRIVGPSEKG
ncbi:MAG TPA: hypothetical protein VJ836_01230 [Candidatus Saccharimonadales bacterium]|nr:hypothetical protein [Candidatus Saccharimonadales bacterium]